jgi:hypothetical protein
MAVTVSASNTGVDTGSSHPNYSVTVTIPSAGSGAAGDFIIVHAQVRAPRGYPVGDNTPGIKITASGNGGLTGPTTGSALAPPNSDTITTGSASHDLQFFEWYGRRSDFTGGTITFTQGPVTTSAGEMYASITTIVVDDPGTLTGQATSSASSPGTIADPGGGTGDYCVAVAGSFFTGPAWSSGSFSTVATRTNTPPSTLSHTLIVGDRTPFAAATYNAGFVGFATSFAFGDPPPVVRGRRGLGLIRG